MASESKPGRAAGGKPVLKRTGARAQKRGSISQLLSMDSERSARILLFGAVGLIVVIAAAFIAFGYWYAEIRPEGRTVLKADDITVSFKSMKRRMAYELFITPQYQQAPQVLPVGAYQSLLNELTVISRAGELNVTATDEEVETRLRERIGVTADADQRTFADRFRTALDASGLSESEYRRMVKSDVLEKKIRDQFTAQAPATVQQSQVELISTADREKADAARARVAAGEDWATVAREVSTEPDVQTTGGLQDYGPQGTLNQAYGDFAFSANPGDISEPLSLIDGQGPYYVVRVKDRSDQPLTDDQKPSYVSAQYNKWLEDTQAKMTIERHWDTADQQEALLDVLKKSPPQQQQQQPIVVPTVVPGSPAAGEPTSAAPQAPPANPDGTGDSGPPPSGAPQPNGQ
jgi:parvulin-like peptidyl-prolyl isomerase